MKNLLSIASSIIYVLIIVMATLSSCERINIPEQESAGHLLTLRIHGFSSVPFPDGTDSSTRAGTEPVTGSSSVTHLDIALFNSDGEKVVKLNQHSGDTTFGSPQIRVPEGTYTLVVVAHSGSGVATITSPTEVTFPNNKVTDTFCTCQTLTVDENTNSLDISLQRAVAMVRVILTDSELPTEFSQLQLYYTGGSSTFSPQAGIGSKNSRQTELRKLAEVRKDSEGHPIFEIYTFPHMQEGVIKLTLTPQNAQGSPIASESIISEVPIRVNYITEARGYLFSGGSSSFSTILSICIQDQWEGTYSLDF